MSAPNFETVARACFETVERVCFDTLMPAPDRQGMYRIDIIIGENTPYQRIEYGWIPEAEAKQLMLLLSNPKV